MILAGQCKDITSNMEQVEYTKERYPNIACHISNMVPLGTIWAALSDLSRPSTQATSQHWWCASLKNGSSLTARTARRRGTNRRPLARAAIYAHRMRYVGNQSRSTLACEHRPVWIESGADPTEQRPDRPAIKCLGGKSIGRVVAASGLAANKGLAVTHWVAKTSGIAMVSLQPLHAI